MKVPGGFLKHPRRVRSRRPAEERVKDFREIDKFPAAGQASIQADRCLDCGIPFCHGLGCPLGNSIPDVNGFASLGNIEEAWRRLQETNPMPEITGRICPAPCEKACTLALGNDAVSIRDIELFVSEEAFKRGLVKPVRPKRETGRKVIVIGSGPAGLAAASRLRRKGHTVTVMEKAFLPGGMLRFGIPDFKLDKSVVDRRIKIFEEEGVAFRTGFRAGVDMKAENILKSCDALLIATGARQPRDLNVEGRELEGIYFAMEYLWGMNSFCAGMQREDKIISAKGKNVLVIGGGDTGSDCACSAIRQGARDVLQVEIMPPPPQDKGGINPSWPAMTPVMKKSPSDEEGARRMWSVGLEKFEGKDGRVKSAHLAEVKQSSGGFEKVPGSEFEVETELVILAMGFLHLRHDALIGELGLKLDGRGNIETSRSFTSREGVFSAGDAARGASLVVSALEDGISAAEDIDAYLSGDKKERK